MLYNDLTLSASIAIALLALLTALVGSVIYYRQRYATMLLKLARFINENSRLSRENQHLRVELTRLANYKPTEL